VAGILTVAAASLNWGAFSAILIGLGMGVVALREGSSFRALLLRGAAGVAGILSGVLALNLLLGINLIQDFAADTGFQRASTTYSRPAAYWIVGSLAAFFISAGVAQSSLFLTEIRSRWKARTFGFETVVLIAIVLVDLSTVYRGETDRAWLFLLPLVVGVAAAARERVRASVGVSLTQSLAEGVLLYTWW
jgi:hypothetical protein